MKLEKEHYTITDFTEPGPVLRRLYPIVKATLSPEKMTYPFFLSFYLNSKPHKMQVTFLTHKGDDVGFFTCTYSHQQLLGKKTVICRVAIGILEKYQKGNMPFAVLCKRIITYKLQHPFRPVYMVAYLANPFVYAAITKYTDEHWPRESKEAPPFIIQLKDNILEIGNLKKRETSPFILLIHFHVQLSASLLKRIYESNDPAVKYYIKINPGFENQMGVMTIVPVRWSNIAANVMKAMIVRPVKKYSRELSKSFRY